MVKELSINVKIMINATETSEPIIPPLRRLGRGIARTVRRNVCPDPVGGAAANYAEAVKAFIDSTRIKSVVELGCGDFRVGRSIIRTGVRYTGVDPSDAAVARNRELYAGRKVRFLVGDAVRDLLPDGELCLVGDLFRHITNAEIRLLLLKLDKFKYIIYNDIQPSFGTFVPNLDKPPGGTRLDRHSALDLRKPPFDLKYVEYFVGLFSENPVYEPGERSCSFLIRSDYQTEYLDPVYLD